MELVLLAGLIACSISNVVLIRKIKNYSEVTTTLEVLEQPHCDCISKVEELLGSFKPEEPIRLPEPDESHFAWKNRREEPRIAPPSPHRPAPVPGPLERPYGFPL